MTTAPYCLRKSVIRAATVASIALILGACAKVDGPQLGLGSSDDGTKLADAGSSDMGKALIYWGRKYAKSPQDKTAALNYAKNLKASGDSKQALRVLQQASSIHGNDREIASEYGRLALEAGQVDLANKLLALADDRTRPDWRIVSGRGAALAQLGKYEEAVSMFERAHKLAPSNPTVLNNLAMAHAGNKNLKQAEMLLQQASANPMAREKVAQNLALVLNLQGRKAEAEAVKAKAAALHSVAMRKSVQPSPSRSQPGAIAQATRR